MPTPDIFNLIIFKNFFILFAICCIIHRKLKQKTDLLNESSGVESRAVDRAKKGIKG